MKVKPTQLIEPIIAHQQEQEGEEQPLLRQTAAEPHRLCNKVLVSQKLFGTGWPTFCGGFYEALHNTQTDA